MTRRVATGRAYKSLIALVVCLGMAIGPVTGAERVAAPSEDSAVQRRSQAEPSRRSVQEEPVLVLKPAEFQEAKWPMYGRLVPAKPLTAEEEEFAKAFAGELNHALAVVAANPEASFPAGSLAARVRQVYQRLSARKRTAMRTRARDLLSRGVEERRRYFGDSADAGAEARHRRATPVLDSEMKEKLRKAVNARLDARREEITKLVEVMAAGEYVTVPRTWVEAGFFKKEVVSAGVGQMTLHEPQVVDFRWNTEEEGAEQGFWHLLRLGGQSPVILASGVAGDAPHGIFSIDFRKYLPTKPPQTPTVYHVRVLPRKKPPVVTGLQLGGGAGTEVAANAVGPWSKPVFIIHAKTDAPPQTFDFPEVYREARFYLDSLYMVEDQTGPGSEEFHLAGFVQESFATGSGKQVRFGPHYAVLDPDGPREKKFGHRATFHLNNPDQPEWPRSYAVVITIMEEDAGDEIADWQKELWKVADDILSSEIADMVSAYLEEYRDELIGKGISWAGQTVQVASMIASETSAAIGGTIAAAAAMVIAAVVAGMDDDYYGTQAAVLVLPTNLTDYVKGLAGQPRADGGFRLEGEKMRFYGYTSYPSAAAFDGICEVRIHWELRGQEPL